MAGPARQNGGVDDELANPKAPDAPEAPEGGVALNDDERADRLRQLQSLVDLMRPAVQADGGDLVLVSADVESGVVEVQLQGACSSCAISASTLQGGVERILKDRLAWVTDVTGGVDESEDFLESAALGRGAYVPREY
jgi:Fe-S cluster biogenesis protein NfuA